MCIRDSGTVTVCPADSARVGAGVTCRGSVGACDLAETCNGTVTVCPTDNRVGAGTICRSSVGACDLAETCNGSVTVCPADGSRVGAGTICRSSVGACDLAETCNGTATACPTNSARVGAGVICRGSTGACDLAETCNGTVTVCPADSARVGAGVTCRGSVGACDLAETCNGSTTLCPTDNPRPAGSACTPPISGACSAFTCLCPAGQTNCGGICRATGATCTSAGTGGCAQSGTIVCSGTTTACSVGPRTSGACTTPTNGVCDGTGTCVCAAGQTNCSGVCNTTGAACSAGVGACRVVGTIVCSGTTTTCTAVAGTPNPTAYTRVATAQTWLDACSGGTGRATWMPTTDDSATSTTIPFSFSFFGSGYTTIGFSTNGAIGFPSVTSSWGNTTIPSGNPNSIFPFWDDLYTSPTGVCTSTFGSAPNRQFVVQWTGTYYFGGDDGSRLNFEAVLSESTNTIDLLYNGMTGQGDRATGNSATIGIEGPAGRYSDQVGVNVAGSITNLRYQPTGETCNSVDDNCNGVVDEGLGPLVCGIGACRRTATACVSGVTQTCTPGTPTAETCNGVDDNCNGTIDEGAGTTYYRDVDGDGYGSVSSGTVVACSMPGGYSPSSADCNDSNAAVHPGGTEVCNSVDDNCNGTVDDIAAVGCSYNSCVGGTTYCSGGAQYCTYGYYYASGTPCGGGFTCNGSGSCVSPSPVNDRCSSATALSLGAYGNVTTVSGNTCSAAHDTNGLCGASNVSGDVFYSFTISQRELVYFDALGSTYDTVLFLMPSCSSAQPAGWACNDDSCSTFQSQGVQVLNAGTYYLVVGGFSSSCGAFSVHLQHLPASNLANEISRGVTSNVMGTTSGQPNRVTPTCGYSVAPDVTYYYTTCPGQGAGTMNATTCSRATWDTVLNYRQGNTTATFCNDDACAFQSSISGSVVGGGSVNALYIDGYSSSSGTYTINTFLP